MWTMEVEARGTDPREVERPTPAPSANEVLVRIHAASLNYRDLALIRGSHDAGQTYPFVPLSDAAGEVADVGAAVTRFRKGDRVIFTFEPEWIDGPPTRRALDLCLGAPLPGVLAEYRLAHEDHLVRTPQHLTDEQASTLPIAAVTAWMAVGGLRAGQSVVIQGTGGVSLFALQFASRLGARTIVLSSSDEKLQRARELGAQHLINYRATPDWQQEVVSLTGGEGADHIVDVGGAATLDRSLDALRPCGTISVIGFLGGKQLPFNVGKMIGKAAVLRGLSVGPRAAFEEMNAAIERWRLEPVIDRVFARRELGAALDSMAAGAQFGKIALRLT
jgi:NADPH:quinone reductase-like Zn-dependent oxidoreductase